MTTIEYLSFKEVDPDAFIPVLNNLRNREHLIQHPLFNSESIKQWVQEKLKVDAAPGCKLRAILCDHELKGWCGIQYENNEYELAVVLDQSVWGLGKRVYLDLLRSSKELGHEEVTVNFLHTRREYNFMKKIAREVRRSEFLGEEFVSYRISVG